MTINPNFLARMDTSGTNSLDREETNMPKTILQLWDETKTHCISDCAYQMLCYVLEKKTRYTIEQAGRMIPYFWDMTCVEAAEAVAKHHDAMKKREGENYWEDRWEDLWREFAGFPPASRRLSTRRDFRR